MIFVWLWYERGNVAKKVTDKCISCREKFKLTKDNTVAYIYLNKDCADYSYFTSICSHCETKNWTFCYGYLDELAEIINQTQCEVVTAPYPSEKILLDWCRVYKVELLEEKQLESSDERLLAFWHFLLSSDDKYIWQEFGR